MVLSEEVSFYIFFIVGFLWALYMTIKKFKIEPEQRIKKYFESISK